MTIILDNLDPEMLAKLESLAQSHERSLHEEIKVILSQVLDQEMREQERKNDDTLEDVSQLEWHEFIEKTAGSINDDTFFRHPQEVPQIREELE